MISLLCLNPYARLIITTAIVITVGQIRSWLCLLFSITRFPFITVSAAASREREIKNATARLIKTVAADKGKSGQPMSLLLISSF